jgi:hypothetical protein
LGKGGQRRNQQKTGGKNGHAAVSEPRAVRPEHGFSKARPEWCQQLFCGSRHYKLDEIEGRHILQTVKRARLPETLTAGVLKEVAESAAKARNGGEPFAQRFSGSHSHLYRTRGALAVAEA